MQFNKNSWHYKFNSKITSRSQTQDITGLCPYFWFTVWNVVKALGMLVGVVLATTVVGFITTCLFAFLLGIFTHIFVLGDAFVVGRCLFGILSFAALICSFSAMEEGVIKMFPDYMTKPFQKATGAISTQLEAKAPSLVKEYYRAFKSKLCPTIEWKD